MIYLKIIFQRNKVVYHGFKRELHALLNLPPPKPLPLPKPVLNLKALGLDINNKMEENTSKENTIKSLH